MNTTEAINMLAGCGSGERPHTHHPLCQEAIAQLRNDAQVLTELETELAAIRIRAHESRALLQRMVKYVREDKATTARATRLARLTDQVADYLQRTHDPRSILRCTPVESDTKPAAEPPGNTGRETPVQREIGLGPFDGGSEW